MNGIITLATFLVLSSVGLFFWNLIVHYLFWYRAKYVCNRKDIYIYRLLCKRTETCYEDFQIVWKGSVEIFQLTFLL